MDTADTAGRILEFIPDIRAIACVSAWWHNIATTHDDMAYWRNPDGIIAEHKRVAATHALTVREIIRLRKYPLLRECCHINRPIAVVRAVDFGNLPQMRAVIQVCSSSHSTDYIFYRAATIGAAGVIECVLNQCGNDGWFVHVARAIYPEYAGVLFPALAPMIAKNIINAAKAGRRLCAQCQHPDVCTCKCKKCGPVHENY
jgi:hypothetical protein